MSSKLTGVQIHMEDLIKALEPIDYELVGQLRTKLYLHAKNKNRFSIEKNYITIKPDKPMWVLSENTEELTNFL
jgi:hypothetical protein